jgi:hypothetical protein
MAAQSVGKPHYVIRAWLGLALLGLVLGHLHAWGFSPSPHAPSTVAREGIWSVQATALEPGTSTGLTPSGESREAVWAGHGSPSSDSLALDDGDWGDEEVLERMARG